MNPKELKQFIRKFHITSGTVLLVKEGCPLANPRSLDEFSQATKEMGLHNVLAIVVDELDDVKVFNTLDMNRLGWYRLNDVKRLVDPNKSKFVVPKKGEQVEGD